MKKTIKSMLALAVAAFAFTACSDVPEPEGYNPKQGDGLKTYVPEGTGVASDPYNVSGVLEATKDLAKGSTTGTLYTKGYVSKIDTYNSQYNSFNYYITDDPEGKSKAFYVYSGLGLNKAKFTSANDLKVGDAVTICGTITNFNGTIEYEKQNYLVALNGQTAAGGGNTADAIEVTCAEAVTATNNLADNATSTETYAVTGYITTIVGNVSNNQQTFWMADTKDGGKVFEAYWANLPSGVSAFTVGMKVKITGNLTKYVKDGAVTPEIKNATVEILEGGGDTPSTATTEVTCAEAVTATNKLADNATSTETYAVTGYITEVVGSVSKNQQTFWMADTKDGGKVFEAYWANLPSGVSAFTVGMKVKITGNLTKYVKDGAVTPEIKNATVEILEGGGESGGGNSGTTATELTNGGFETWANGLPTGWKSASSASSATLEQSTDAHGGTYSCIVKGGGTANKRLASQEITLAAGSYNFSFYAKATTGNKAQVRAGYAIVENGTINSSSGYKYSTNYADINNNGWTLVSYDFKLDAETVVCLLVMNPKSGSYSSGEDALVDDATLTKK